MPVASLTLAEAMSTPWEVVVIGAGPAGALAARELARRGAKVLLVDKTTFPRPKVCGACLNSRALMVLQSVGLAELVRRSGAVPSRKLHLAARGRTAVLPLSGGLALSREYLDAALIDTALSAGVAFLPGTQAQTEWCDRHQRIVTLQQHGAKERVTPRCVLVAHGLGGNALRREPGVQRQVDENSRIGAGIVVETRNTDYPPGTIFMACGDDGYVGAVRVEDGRLNFAAALAPSFVKRYRGLGQAAAAILQRAGLPLLPGLAEQPWRGTPLLTRRLTRPYAEQLFVLGDAAGYVEPFTGEGIAWALASGAAIAPWAVEAIHGWHASLGRRWATQYRRLVQQRQWPIRIAAAILRHPWLTVGFTQLLGRVPSLARPVLAWMNQPDSVRTTSRDH